MQVVPADIAVRYKKLAEYCYAEVEDVVYHASHGHNASSMGDLLESPATYELRKANPVARTDPMLKGSVSHCIILQPHLYDLLYKVSPVVTKTSKRWKEFSEEWPNHTIISPGMADDCFRMRDACYANPTIKALLEKNKEWREVSIWVRHPETRLVCKIRPDMIGEDNYIYDLKTSIAPQWRAFKHSIWKWNYFISSPFYYDMANLAGLEVKGFRFIVVGSKPPHNTAIYELDFDWANEGRKQYLEALRSYRNYLTGDGWAGFSYGREIKTLTMGGQDE